VLHDWQTRLSTAVCAMPAQSAGLREGLGRALVIMPQARSHYSTVTQERCLLSHFNRVFRACGLHKPDYSGACIANSSMHSVQRTMHRTGTSSDRYHATGFKVHLLHDPTRQPCASTAGRYSRTAAVATEAPQARMRKITSLSEILGEFQVITVCRLQSRLTACFVQVGHWSMQVHQQQPSLSLMCSSSRPMVPNHAHTFQETSTQQ
jgi:hypothetical protein